MELWCDLQMRDREDGSVLCCAHLAEGRVFDCPYEDSRHRLTAEYPCSDYVCKEGL